MTTLQQLSRASTLHFMAYEVRNKTRVAVCGAMLLLPFLLVALPVAYVLGGAYTKTFPRAFNSKSWIISRGSSIDDERRCGMLADLQWRVAIVGRSQAEVIVLLDEPDDRRREPNISYWLLCPSFLDNWILGVRWKDGRAVALIVHDT